MQHCGLYFTQRHIDDALKQRDHEPFKTAWSSLDALTLHDSANVLRSGFWWKFTQNHAAAAHALPILEALTVTPLSDDLPLLNEISEVLALAQAYELLRDYDAFEMGAQARWIDAFHERVSALNTRRDLKLTFVEQLWLNTLNIAAGIVLDRPKIMQVGIDAFEAVIRDEVRPQGFLLQAVDGKDGGGMERQILAAAALTLAAEAASHVGVDLWAYHVRGVSALTAAIYPIYYFYTTDKWKWDPKLPVETVQAAFRQHGSYLEIVHRRTESKDVRTVLSELRPIWSAHGGGMTTLTHGIVTRKGLFG